ncbi:MAG TPA: wax ester/triacylglycerol synthase domain-containing protein, partial [Actinomycetes bacterium]
LSGVQVAITTMVIMATGNHYLLDAVAGAALVGLSVGVAYFLHRSRPGAPLSPADSFFVHVESPDAPQHVGGLVLMGTSHATPSRDELERVIKRALDKVPRFRQRLVEPTRWRRARWVDQADLDWAWHVPEYDVSLPDGRPGGEEAVNRLVAELATIPLPHDRPMWRFAFVTGVGPADAAAILLVHHAVADGFGTVAQGLNFLEPPPEPLRPDDMTSRPSRLRTAGAIIVGLAQLATDGRPSGPLPGTSTAQRRFGTLSVSLDELRAAAQLHGVRITDVMLSAVAGGLRRVRPGGLPRDLRVAVPLMARAPGASAEGNLTAGVITDVPLGQMAEAHRLAETAKHSGRLRTGTRALASHAVIRLTGRMLPPVLHGWFARTVYGKRYFQAIVSNMPGPDSPMTLIGAPMEKVFPILPLAPGAPIVVGALGWEGVVHIAVVTDPGLVEDVDAFSAAIFDVIVELGQSAAAGMREEALAPARPVQRSVAEDELGVGLHHREAQ